MEYRVLSSVHWVSVSVGDYVYDGITWWLRNHLTQIYPLKENSNYYDYIKLNLLIWDKSNMAI